MKRLSIGGAAQLYLLRKYSATHHLSVLGLSISLMYRLIFCTDFEVGVPCVPHGPSKVLPYPFKKMS